MGKFNSLAKGKIVRRYGVNLFGNPKYDRLLAKRPNPPGVHGANQARKKVSEYGQQLAEKQKLKIAYGLREKQFRLTFKKAAAKKGITGNNLLQLLELRLDNVIYRLGWAESRSAARQLVGHGHVKVNGRKVDVASYSVKEGEEITVKDSARSKALIQRNIDACSRAEVPEWIIVNKEELKGQIARMPLTEEIPSVSDVQQVVELYSK